MEARTFRILALAALAALATLGALPLRAQTDYLPYTRSTWPAGIRGSWQIQGEYFGVTSANARLGAWVVSRNPTGSTVTLTRFGVVFLPGGLATLPGDANYGGWDGVTRWQGSGTGSDGIMLTTLNDGKTFTLGTSTTDPATTSTGGVTLDSVTGAGEGRFLHGHTGTGATFTLARVVRGSPTANLRPLSAWGATSWFDTATASADLAKWQAQDNAPNLSQGTYLLRGVKTVSAHGRGFLHVEFLLPFNPYQTGQGRANSGVILQGKYEAQILDSYGLAGLHDEFGGIFNAGAPKINVALPPNSWQTYDIYFTPRSSGSSGQNAGAAYATVYANGVLVQDSVRMPDGDMTAAPLYLQSHNGNNVLFRNVWFIPEATVHSRPWSTVLAEAATSIRGGLQGKAREAGALNGKAVLGFGGDYDLVGRKLQGDAKSFSIQPTVVLPSEKQSGK